MKLENYSYKQSKLVRYFVVVYLFLFIAFCLYLYWYDVGVNLFIVFMNLPIVILLFASFSKKKYFSIENNEFEVYNSFKARKFKFDDIIKIENRNKTWILFLPNEHKISLSNFRVAESDKVHFQNQMEKIQDYLKKNNSGLEATND